MNGTVKVLYLRVLTQFFSALWNFFVSFSLFWGFGVGGFIPGYRVMDKLLVSECAASLGFPHARNVQFESHQDGNSENPTATY